MHIQQHTLNQYLKHTLLLTLTIAIVNVSNVCQAKQPNTIPAGYHVETIKIPDNVHFGVAGIAVDKDGTVYCGTRFGDVYSYHNNSWTLFASGLHEIADLRIDTKGRLLAAQKPEITHLVDTNKDGVCDQYINICDDFGFSGNYHEFTFGPVFDSKGHLYATLNLSHGAGDHAYKSTMGAAALDRGTTITMTPSGQMSTFAWGLRSPAGIGINSKTDDLFFTDNQGDWNPTSSLYHIQKGHFYGQPVSLRQRADFGSIEKVNSTSIETFEKMRTRPAVWIPHGEIANSPGNPIFDYTEGKFGPFTGQIFCGDQMRSNIFRMVLEKVQGAYQGCVINFIDHLQCGAIRLDFAPDGSMWVGQTSRGWSAVGDKPFGVQRIVYDGNTIPFAIEKVTLTHDGFDVHFTKPVAKTDMLSTKDLTINHWHYYYGPKYGSPKEDKTTPEIKSVTALNRKTVRIKLDTLVTKEVYYIKLNNIKSADGDSLATNEAYYTLNNTL